MFNQPYFIPSYYSSMAAPSMMRSAMGMGSALRGASAAAGASKGLGIFGKLGSSFSAMRGINWGGLITNASKTLGVINQAIPLVRQVGPMFNNMRSMLRVASIFKDETDNRSPSRATTTTRSANYNISNNNSYFQPEYSYSRNSSLETNSSRSQTNYTTKESDISPTFFIET